MESNTAPRIIAWRIGTVLEIVIETPRVHSLILDVPDWPGHLAGQHVDVRLTADDGYQTERSYSIASPPESTRLALTVERLKDGEVSSYLVGDLRVGDPIELRGPIGGHFAWSVRDGGPLLLVGGGSGIVPLMAMLRHRATASEEVRRAIPARLLYSSRSWSELIFRDELARLAAADASLDVVHTITREPPPRGPAITDASIARCSKRRRGRRRRSHISSCAARRRSSRWWPRGSSRWATIRSRCAPSASDRRAPPLIERKRRAP